MSLFKTWIIDLIGFLYIFHFLFSNTYIFDPKRECNLLGVLQFWKNEKKNVWVLKDIFPHSRCRWRFLLRPRPATLLKKSHWHRCFPVNIAKFLRTPFFTEHLRTTAFKCSRWLRLLLNLLITAQYIDLFDLSFSVYIKEHVQSGTENICKCFKFWYSK